MNIIVHFDGGCEPVNPGGTATYGFTVDGDGDRVEFAGVIGTGPGMTNNLAEYTALKKALEHVGGIINPGSTLTIRGDSQLVVNQIKKVWKCNHEHLISLRDECLDLLDELACEWLIEWVPREQNQHADAMTQRAYIEATGKAPPVRRSR